MHPNPKHIVFCIRTHPRPTPCDFRARLGLRLQVGLEPDTRCIGILLVCQPLYNWKPVFGDKIT